LIPRICIGAFAPTTCREASSLQTSSWWIGVRAFLLPLAGHRVTGAFTLEKKPAKKPLPQHEVAQTAN